MQDQGPWGDCPFGVVTDLAGQLRRRERRAQFRPFILIGLAVLLISAVGYGLTSRDKTGSRAGLNCRDTIPLLAKYHDQALNAALSGDVREHLSRCPSCREHYEELYPSEVRTRSSVGTGFVAVAAQFLR